MARVATKIKGYRLPEKDVRPPSNKFVHTILAGMASVGPPLGPLLGKYGVNIAKFCKDYNEKTSHFVKGIPIPTVITVNPDRSYVMEFMKPPFSYYLQQAAGITDFQTYNGFGFIFAHVAGNISGMTVAADNNENLLFGSDSEHQSFFSFILIFDTCVARYNRISGKVTLKHIYEIAVIKHSDPYSFIQLRELKDVCQKYLRQAYLSGVEVVSEINPEEYAQFLKERKEYLVKLAQELAAEQEAKLLRG